MSVTVAWPLVAKAQTSERVRRVGLLIGLPASDPEGQARFIALVQGLALLGWVDGRNIRIDVRWGQANAEFSGKDVSELVALRPDLIVSGGGTVTTPLLQATHTLPVVFVHVTDPVAAGLVDSLSRPGGNATGFTNFEFGIASKWLEILKDISPRLARVAVLRDASIPQGIGQYAAIQGGASSLGIELIPINIRDSGAIERAIANFARGPNGSLIVTSGALLTRNRDLIISLAARHKLPAIYSQRPFASAGGLVAYGPDRVEQYRRAADYVDRILKGEKPADLPVQAPTKYELVINLKTAKTLGLTIPPTLLARADEVIE